MKRLCIITPTLGKYSETFIQNQIDNLPFEKFVVTTGTGEFADKNGVPLARFNLFAKAKRIVGRKLLNENFETQQNKLLETFLKQNKVDHVLFQYGPSAKKGYKACKKLSIPFTVHFHGFDAYSHIYDKSYYSEVLKYSENIVVVSNDMKNRLLQLGAIEKRIYVIPCGALINSNTIKNNQIGKGKIFTLVAVGRFVEKKAPYLTILAFAKAVKQNENLRLKMVGEGDLLPICKDLVFALGLEEKVEFLGKLNHDEVISFINNADCFIQHSKTSENGDKEGMPVAIMEALNLKTPIISTIHSGIPDIVKHGINGLLSNEKDIDAMAENILKSIEFTFKFPENEYLELDKSIKKLAKVLNE